MITIANSIEINVPIKQLFAFLSDPETLPFWNYYVIKVVRISPETKGIGARYRQTRKEDEQIFEIASLNENRLIELRTISGSSLQFRRQMTFTEIGHKCVLEDFFEMDTGHPGLLQKVMAGSIRAAVSENLGKLKQLLEEGKTTLQDGRVIEHPIS